MTTFELATKHTEAMNKVDETGEKIKAIYRELVKIQIELPVDESTREFNESNKEIKDI